MLTTIINAIQADPTATVYWTIGLAIAGAAFGIYRSLRWCSYNRHTGRRVR